MKICVAGGRGYRGREEPGVFYLGGKRLPVLAIVERWNDTQHAYYRVQVEDGRRFVLRYDQASASWELVSVSPKPAPKPISGRPARLHW